MLSRNILTGELVLVSGPVKTASLTEKPEIFLSNAQIAFFIEDVTTSGKSIEETFPILKSQANVDVVGLMVSLNRQERGKTQQNALAEIREVYGIETGAIVTMEEVVEYLYNKPYNGKVLIDDKMKEAIDAYYAQYGAK